MNPSSYIYSNCSEARQDPKQNGSSHLHITEVILGKTDRKEHLNGMKYHFVPGK